MVAGYRLFRYTLVVVGAGFAGIPCWVFTWDHVQQLGGGISDSTAVILGGVAGGLGGVLGGLLCWKVWKIGVFVIGAALGVVLAVVLHITVFCHLHQGNMPLIVAGVLLGLSAGALSLRFMRKAMVVSTSVLGAYGSLRGVSLFVPGSYTDELLVAAEVQAGKAIPAAMFGYLSGMALLALAGVLVQFLVTAVKPRGGGDKDEFEEEFEGSELTLEALAGGGGSKKKKKKKKRSKAERRLREAQRGLKGDALLRDWEEGSEFYEGDAMEEGPWEGPGEERAQDYYGEEVSEPAAAKKKGFFSRLAAKVKGGRRGGSVQRVDW